MLDASVDAAARHGVEPASTQPQGASVDAAARHGVEPSTQPQGSFSFEQDNFIFALLDANQSARVKDLFTTWDIDASGKLELAAFSGAVTKVGPHQTKVLAQLQDMDVDHDGFVTQAVTTPNELPAASARPRAHCCTHTHTHTHTH